VGDWMERLQSEGVRGADLVFACIGPALEVYSRYSHVETPDGHEVPLGGDPEAREPHLRGFLAYVWETIGRAALEQVLGTAEATARNGAAGAIEEDARLTALFLWTLQSTAGENGAPAPDDTEADDSDDEEEGSTRSRAKGFTLVYDVVRRFAQPLGIHLDEWEDRIIKTEKGVVRLLPVSERARQLFGVDGAQAVASQIEQDATRAANFQMSLFPDEAPSVRGHKRKPRGQAALMSDDDLQTRREATTLDRIHAAMLLQAGGRTNALRALLQAEVDRGPDFVRLANALSALYPIGSEEKRLTDAMLLAVPR
jgi:putative DNA methylase